MVTQGITDQIKKQVVQNTSIDPQKVFRLYYGIDMAKYKPDNVQGQVIRKEYGISKNDIVIGDTIIQIRDHQFTHVILNRYIGDSPIYGILNTTLKTSHNLVTNVVIANGISTFYITWNDYEGGFTGVKAMKADLNADIEAGEFILTGTFNMHGFGDFEGMKLRGIINGYNIMNFMIGTVLIPN